MALIKYYNLESQSWEEVSELERNLQKHLLSEKHIKGLVETSIEDSVNAKSGNGSPETLSKLIYDSGDFDVLYRNSLIISKGKKRLFGENIAPRIGTELVVRARPEDILELQDYLGSSSFEVVEARGITQATLTMATHAGHAGFTENSAEHLQTYLSSRYGDQLKSDIKVQHKVHWMGRSGSMCTAVVIGPVQEILEVRKFALGNGYGEKFALESVSFFK
ncbi:hypothetical protein GOV03_01770 [Candidatus Woesearchaeota archaeon]|nr:hypothetical protein [Candidatus Woesearchaeota archaeon]